MTVGLPVSRVVNVTASLAALTAQFVNLSAALLVGESDVIDTTQRIREYSSLGQIGIDFGNTSPEYLAAVPYFGRAPQPKTLLIGKWAQTATAGRLVGGQLLAAQQALAAFNAITTGSLKVSVDGAGAAQITALNFSAATTLQGVASIINTALTAAVIGASVAWNGYQFVMKSATSGPASAVAIPVAPSSGVNIATVMGWTLATGAYAVAGIAAESLLTAIQIMDGLTTPFYHVNTDACPDSVDADREAVAAYVEGSTNPHVYSFTSKDPNALNPASTSDVGYILSQAGYTRTFYQFSTTGPAAAMSMVAFAVNINWLGSDTAPNFMWQSEPGITPETLNVAQANSLDGKRYNYTANYANGVAILQNGTMAGPYYCDERIGIDWLVNYVQTNLFNFMAGVGTKVAQTDAGMHLLQNNIEGSMAQSVNNALVAPGTWTSGGFGQLVTGQFLPKGYYVYAPPIALQDVTSRGNRQSVAFQVAAKFAGAVNDVDVAITLNR